MTYFNRDEVITRSSGIITSPRWPQPYQSRDIPCTDECEWDIKTSPNRVIQINFMDLDTKSSPCYRKYIKIKGALYFYFSSFFKRKIYVLAKKMAHYEEFLIECNWVYR